MAATLRELLLPERLTAVVDIGANPIDGDPPYKALLQGEGCTVVGFEPQPAALLRLLETKSASETYLPYAVGDGGEHVLHICTAPGMTSLLKPDPRALALFPMFAEWGTVVREEPIQTHRLDDIAEVEHLDFLKIDVQGSELSVFRGGAGKLQHAVAVQTEVSFVPIYENQPPYWMIDRELRSQGFIPHAFVAINRRMILPMSARDDPHQSLNQLLEADIVYVRDFVRTDGASDEQLKHLALIAHTCYTSFDLALYCIKQLVGRGSVAPGVMRQYLEVLRA